MASTRSLTIAPAHAFLAALRPRQWVKNVLVAAAPAAAGGLDQLEVLARTAGAIGVFVAAAGCTYLFNDAADVEADRAHPTKRHRPVAAGTISAATARLGAVVLAVGALGAGTALAWEFGAVIGTYLAINAAYSAGMKHVPGVELAAIASGFVLRAIGGGAATAIPLSGWFVAVVCATALFVVAGKRSAELARTGGQGGRRVLAHYDIASLRALRAATAGAAVVAYAFWVIAQDLAITWLAAASLFPFAAGLARYAGAVDEGRGEDPEDIILGDRAIQVIGVAWVVVYGAAVYA